MTGAAARREQARVQNEMIDRALLAAAPGGPANTAQLLKRREATSVADRVRLRAMRLASVDASRRSQILAASDALVLAVYRQAAPRRWLYGWCDASVARDGSERRAGVGGIILDDRGKTVARICQRIAERDPFEAEIAALEAMLKAAAAQRDDALRIRVHTDCDALVSLWLQSRGDPRLQVVRALARSLRRFELYSVPRRHNQTAHRLARDGALGYVRQSELDRPRHA